MSDTPVYRRTEVIITLLVILALAAWSIPRFIKAQRETKEKICHVNRGEIERHVELYQLAGDESPPPSLDVLYGPGKVAEAMPECPFKGQYRLEDGKVFCGHVQK